MRIQKKVFSAMHSIHPAFLQSLFAANISITTRIKAKCAETEHRNHKKSSSECIDRNSFMLERVLRESYQIRDTTLTMCSIRSTIAHSSFVQGVLVVGRILTTSIAGIAWTSNVRSCTLLQTFVHMLRIKRARE